MKKIAFYAMVLTNLFLFGFALAQKPTPSPTPEMATTGPLKVWPDTFVATSITMPRMVINFSGEKLLEINVDGKRLTVLANGEIHGDLPHDKAADAFWKSLAKAFPEMCSQEPGGR